MSVQARVCACVREGARAGFRQSSAESCARGGRRELAPGEFRGGGRDGGAGRAKVQTGCLSPRRGPACPLGAGASGLTAFPALVLAWRQQPHDSAARPWAAAAADLDGQAAPSPRAPGPPAPGPPGWDPAQGRSPHPHFLLTLLGQDSLNRSPLRLEPGWRLGPKGSGLGSQMGAGWPGLESGIQPLSWYLEEACRGGDVGHARRQGWSPLPEAAFPGKSQGSPPLYTQARCPAWKLRPGWELGCAFLPSWKWQHPPRPVPS